MSPLARLDSYESAEEHWQTLLPECAVNNLFLTHQWQKVWWERFSGGWEMLLLYLNGQKGVEAIAPLARRNGTISFIGSQDLCDYGDFLVSRGSERRFYDSLLSYLGGGEEWDTLQLFSVAEGSPTLAYLPDLARERGYSVEVLEEDVAPGVSLPASWEEYLESLSKKDRHELRRKLRRLETCGQGYRYYKLSDPKDVEGSIDDFFTLMRSSREPKGRFLTPVREQFFRSIAMELSSIGVFKLFFLEMNGERVAATMCFDYGNARLLYNSGFQPTYAYYSVGLLLKALCLKDAIEEGRNYFDFLRGAEPYKYDLGGKDRTLYQIVVKRS